MFNHAICNISYSISSVLFPLLLSSWQFISHDSYFLSFCYLFSRKGNNKKKTCVKYTTRSHRYWYCKSTSARIFFHASDGTMRGVFEVHICVCAYAFEAYYFIFGSISSSSFLLQNLCFYFLFVFSVLLLLLWLLLLLLLLMLLKK